MRHLLAVALLAALPFLGRAQRCDTCADADRAHLESRHAFRAAQLAAPSALLAAGICGHSISGLHDLDVALHEDIEAHSPTRCTVDNYLQYLPLAAAAGLRLCGMESEHRYRDLLPLMAEAYAIGGATVTVVKLCVDVRRPDQSAMNSFPSGHTFTAFVGAEILRREYGSEYPMVAVAGYAVAAGVGLMRVYNSRHWMADVLGGAGIGILAASAAYWTYPTINRWITGSRCRLDVAPTSLTLNF